MVGRGAIMSVEFKDYYKTLGVPRTADADQIRKAFRSLARQYHPDVAKDKRGGEEKFKEINEAYEVLGDQEKRRKYDAMGADWRERGFTPPPRSQSYSSRRATPGAGAEPFEFHGTGFSDFFEQFFGGLGGYSRRDGFTAAESERGQDVEADIMVTLEESFRGAIRPITLRRNTPCPACDATGIQKRRPCAACEGSGQASTTQRYQVKIPAGVHDGQRLRITGQGEPGEGGGKPGDLYLKVRLASHPDFRADGGDLYHDLELAPWEAVLGAGVSVPTLSGHVNIKIPQGTQNGQRLRIRGHGLPGHDGEVGDLFVIARIQMPSSLTDREKALWQELAKTSPFRPR